MMAGDEFYDDDVTSGPIEDGCICQTCAERGVECVRVAEAGRDECVFCRRGEHRA